MTSHAVKAPFAGFPTGAHRTSIPNVFFSELLPQIEDEAELRVTLYVFYALSRRKGYPRFVALNELRAEAPLLASLGDGGDAEPLAKLERGLEAAIERGTLLALDIESPGTASPSTGSGQAAGFSRLILLNTASDRRAVEQIQDVEHIRPIPVYGRIRTDGNQINSQHASSLAGNSNSIAGEFWSDTSEITAATCTGGEATGAPAGLLS